MDNKQDRQFLSKVKNFINSSQSFNFSQKDDPLLNSIKNIVEKNQNTTKTKYQSHITNIESIDKEISTVKPSLFGIKNLNEYTQSEEEITRIRQERQASRERTRQRNAEENERLAAAKEAVKAKQAAAPQKTAAQKEDEQAEYMASRIAELSGKKPEELTSKEAGELSLMKSMTQGKVATRGLEGKIQGKLEAKAKVSPLAMEPTAGTDDTGRTQEQIDMDAMASGKPGPDDAAKRKAAAQGMMQRTIGRGQEELVGLTQTAIGRETEEKKAADAQYNQQMQARRLKEREGQLIQGTKMTYGDFKRETGREYDATNKDDSSLVIKLASQSSAGRYGSETARQSALTADQMNQAYAQQNREMAQKFGQAERTMDVSQRELDKFRTDRTYRQGVVQGDISRIQSQPGFVKNIAQNIAQNAADETSARTRLADVMAAYEERRRSQPARVGTPDLLAKPPSTPPGLLSRPEGAAPEAPTLLQKPLPIPTSTPLAPPMLRSGDITPELLRRPENTPPDLLSRDVAPARPAYRTRKTFTLTQAINSVLGKK